MDTRVKIISNQPSCLNHFLQEIRDENIQKDRLRFRTNLERIGEVMAMEVSKVLPYSPQMVTTPLGESEIELLDSQPVIVSVLRASLPMHIGVLRYFDRSDNGFISAYRHTTKGNKFEIKIEYMALPPIDGRPLILVDPMIASGNTIVETYHQIAANHKLGEVFICGAIGSEAGIKHVLNNVPKAQIFVGAVDKELTAKSYIVPGLGDAGDLAFGPK